MAVSHLRNTPITGKSYTTPVDATEIRTPATSTSIQVVRAAVVQEKSDRCCRQCFSIQPICPRSNLIASGRPCRGV